MEKIENNIKIALIGTDVELYDILTLKENNNNILRIYLTQQGGITLDKCTEVTKLISPILDMYAPFDGEYTLEVSSPGIERKLKKPKHFQASIGEKIKIKDFNKDILLGTLLKANQEEIEIETEHGKEIITYDEIAQASTYFEW